jgi:putative flippase GtrA
MIGSKIEIITYIVVGLLTLCIELGIFLLLRSAGVSAYLSAIVSYTLPFIFNYIAHCLLTFKTTPSSASVVRYFIVLVVNTVIHTGLFWIGSHWLGLTANSAKLGATALSAILNYFMQKYFTFGWVQQRSSA